MYVKIVEDGLSASLIKLELDEHMCLSLTYLKSYFPGALGLKYKDDESEEWCGPLYKSTKFGNDNPLLPTSYFPLNKTNEQNEISVNNNTTYDSILNHSLISYTQNNTNQIIISYNDNKWSLMNQNKNHVSDLSTTNYFNFFTLSNTSVLKTNKVPTTTTLTSTEISNTIERFKNFISTLITKTYHTNGYIQSCQQGTKNQSLLFYNIVGSFRYCERLQRHHKSNQTCIIIDTFTYKYQIKCKDPDCRNYKPPWKDISQFNE